MRTATQKRQNTIRRDDIETRIEAIDWARV